ncbi:DUF3025 domain-containing protein [Caenimonas soli]|uniref:DUF3025 domain-containing protein n=1 Tax=Caenimonas soli TaxID=2735555 RepID=UPI002E2D303C|nr:DUF3025 domain-containing protein [Caenimonas soli]
MGGWREQLRELDSGGPWFAPWRLVGNQVAASLAAGAPLHEALNAHAATNLQFVAAQELPQGMAYEQYIFETARCPTRENLHDFFNGLCWLQFPLAKKRLNELQADEIARAGVGGVRGPVRDAITVFDENGALLDAPSALWQALLARDWPRIFIDLRPLWAQARVIVFGHALLEKLVRPRKDITAHVWRFACPSGSMAEVDRWLAGQLTAGSLAAKPFAPLPVMGVPGWNAENEDLSFYDDALVFRPAGRETSRT